MTSLAWILLGGSVSHVIITSNIELGSFVVEVAILLVLLRKEV